MAQSFSSRRRPVSVTIPDEIIQAMDAVSALNHRPRSWQYEVALKAYLDSLIEQGVQEADYRQYEEHSER